jgi:hypothetical protein
VTAARRARATTRTGTIPPVAITRRRIVTTAGAPTAARTAGRPVIPPASVAGVGAGVAGGISAVGARTRAAAAPTHVFVVMPTLLARVRLVAADRRPPSIVLVAAMVAPPVLPTAPIVAIAVASAAGPIVAAGVVGHVSSRRAAVRSQFSVVVRANRERMPGGDVGRVDGDGPWSLGSVMAGTAVVDRHTGAERAGDDHRRQPDLQRPGTACPDRRRTGAGQGARADARFRRGGSLQQRSQPRQWQQRAEA